VSLLALFLFLMTTTLFVEDLEVALDMISENAVSERHRVRDMINMAKRGVFRPFTGIPAALEVCDRFLRPVTDWLGPENNTARRMLLGILRNLGDLKYVDPFTEADRALAYRLVQEAEAERSLTFEERQKRQKEAEEKQRLQREKEAAEEKAARKPVSMDPHIAAILQMLREKDRVPLPPPQVVDPLYAMCFNIGLYEPPRQETNNYGKGKRKRPMILTKLGQKELEQEEKEDLKQRKKIQSTPRKRVLVKIGVATVTKTRERTPEEKPTKNKRRKTIEFTADELEEVGIVNDSADEAERDQVPTDPEPQPEKEEKQPASPSPPRPSPRPPRRGPRRTRVQ